MRDWFLEGTWRTALLRGVKSHLYLLAYCLIYRKSEGRGDILVTIARKKVRIQFLQIKLEHPNPMSTINQTQHPLLPTNPHQVLKREPNPRDTNDGLKHRDLRSAALTLNFLHLRTKLLHQFVVRDWKLILYFPPLSGCRLLHSLDRLPNSTIDGIEVDDHITRRENQVPENCVNARRGVLDKDAFVYGDIQVGG